MNKFILNGSFRSGTTYFWDALDSQLTGTVLYEPCHENILNLVLNSKDKVDSLHELKIWDCYNKETIQVLKEYNNVDFYQNGVIFSAYVNDLFNCEGIAGLQSNRWHYQYPTLLSEGFNVFHLLRNPILVYSSIIKSYLNQGHFVFKYAKKTLAKNYINKKAFNIEKWYLYSCSIECDEPRLSSAFDMFLYTWISMNYYSLIILIDNGLSDNVFFYDLVPEMKDKYEQVFTKYGCCISLSSFSYNDKKPREFFGVEDVAIKIGLYDKLIYIWNQYVSQKSCISI
jgi:hypothetical protein